MTSSHYFRGRVNFGRLWILVVNINVCKDIGHRSLRLVTFRCFKAMYAAGSIAGVFSKARNEVVPWCGFYTFLL